MIVKIKKTHPDAKIPKYAKPGDAGADLVAVSKTYIHDGTNEYTEYDIGLSFEIPEGWEGEIRPRSSISNTGFILTNAPGTIDSQFRGSVKARFKRISGGVEYEVGDKICQLLIKPAPQVQFEEVTELSNTDRGTGGFGSSGS